MNYKLAASAVCLGLLASACSPNGDVDVAPPTTSESTVSPTSETPTPTEEQPVSLDAYFADLEERGFDGTVLIQNGDETISKGFGLADRDTETVNTADTIFDIGSITKQFTAAGILRLEMDGLLTVEDPISNYVDELPDGYEDVTLHHLLTHSSGIRDGDGFDYDDIDLPTFVAELEPLKTTPGETYAYSNSGYSLLAATIERVTQDSYEAYLNEALFTPAGMNLTGYVLPDWGDSVIAVGYEGAINNTTFARPNELPWAEDGPYWYLRGNGGILSSAEDMLLWHEALNGNEILDEEAKEKLFEPHIIEEESGEIASGYGWAIVPTESAGTLITHNGGNGVFFADFLRFVEEDVMIFTATNDGQLDFETVAYDLANIVLGTDEFTDVPSLCQFSQFDDAEIETFTTLDEFGESPSEQTLAAFFELLADGDEPSWREFAETSISDEFANGDEVAEQGPAIQDEFGSFSVTQIVQSDPQTYHVAIDSANEGELVVSVGFTGEEPPEINCVDIG